MLSNNCDLEFFSGLCTILGLDVHPQLLRRNLGVAAAAQNNANDEQDDSDDNYIYVLDFSDEE